MSTRTTAGSLGHRLQQGVSWVWTLHTGHGFAHERLDMLKAEQARRTYRAPF